MNTMLFLSKYLTDNTPFPLQKYSDIKGYEGSTEDLREGEFEDPFGTIKRFDNKQLQVYSDRDSSEMHIKWISNNEYRLVRIGESHGMVDTLYIKVTNNTKEYYECYLKFGEYADYQKITKK